MNSCYPPDGTYQISVVTIHLYVGSLIKHPELILTRDKLPVTIDTMQEFNVP